MGKAVTRKSILEGFAGRYAMSTETARKLKTLVRKYHRDAERCCKGDPHPRNPNPSDKSRNAELWDQEASGTARKIDAIAIHFFDRVDYGVGLTPVFEKGSDTCIMIPQ